MASIEKRFDRLAKAAWRISDETVNAGGCAGFAGVVGACARAVGVPCRTLPVVLRWQEWEFRDTWEKSPGPEALADSWHLVSAVTIGTREYVVDAAIGLATIHEFREYWDDESLLTLDDIAAKPRTAWLAYKHARWWNDEFQRSTMPRIARAAWLLFRPLHRASP